MIDKFKRSITPAFHILRRPFFQNKIDVVARDRACFIRFLTLTV